MQHCFNSSKKGNHIIAILTFALFLILGCTTALNYEQAKSLPDVVEFMKTHPTALLSVDKLSADGSKLAPFLTPDCNNIPYNEYFFIRADDDNESLHLWVDSRKWAPICSIVISNIEEDDNKKNREIPKAEVIIASKERIGNENISAKIKDFKVLDKNNALPASIENQTAVFRGTQDKLHYIGKFITPQSKFISMHLETGELISSLSTSKKTLSEGINVRVPLIFNATRLDKKIVVLDFNTILKNNYSLSIKIYSNSLPDINTEIIPPIVTTQKNGDLQSISHIIFDDKGNIIEEYQFAQEVIKESFEKSKFREDFDLQVIDKKTVFVTGTIAGFNAYAIIDINDDYRILEKVIKK